MHPYIKHLLHDITNAKRCEEDSCNFPPPKSFEEEMLEIEKYISGDAEHSLSYYTGLKKEDFPPSEQLSEKDIKITLKAFDEMLETWNATIDYPEKMPCTDRYDFLRSNVLEEGFTPIKHGFIHFDFCTGYAPDCAWGKYCHCRDVWNEDT